MERADRLGFGRCPCGGSYTRSLVQIAFGEDKDPLTDVPQGRCPVCGGWVYRTPQLAVVTAAFVGGRVTPRRPVW
ncbi:hypothetical protein ACVW07_000358 [Cellulomonas sp. URHB0016]